MRSLFTTIAAFLLLFSSCSKRSISHLEGVGVQITNSRTILIDPQPTDTIRLQYLGCGGFYVRDGRQAIMIDPFFSHQRFMRIGKSILMGADIRSKSKELAYGKRMIKDSLNISDERMRAEVKGIFAAHGHYDHLMDVPWILNEWTGSATVFANTSAGITCANVIPFSNFKDVERIASIREQPGDSVVFTEGGSTIRVYPIFADHNPHSRNIKLFAGSAVETPSHYRSHKDRTTVHDWLEGQTLSFLIDFVSGKNVKFRMFIQSSSCQFPNGMPPQQLLKEKGIDLAVLGVASYLFSENTYPCEFIRSLKPANLMFIHWEDFFRMLRQRPKAVKTNDVGRFFTDVFSKCRQDYMMPLPGSVITIGY